MPKGKKKPIRKTKKKPARPAKRARAKKPAQKKKPVRKKKPVKSQKRPAGVLEVEISGVEVILSDADDAPDAVEEEVNVRDPLDEHFPPDYGGSE